MNVIKITDERIDAILPKSIKDSDVLSNNDKKVLGAILHYFLILDKAKENRYVILTNEDLRKTVCIRKSSVLSSIQNLIEMNLIIRECGKTWSQGEKPKASKYYVNWNNLKKPLKKPEFEDLFSDFISSETPMGTIDIDSDTDIDSDIDSDEETDTDTIVTYETSEENKLKEKNKIKKETEIEPFQTVTLETNEEDFNKISNEENESSSDDTLDNDNNNSNLEEDMNMMTIPQGQIDALHSYVENHINSSTTSDEYAEVEKNLNNYFNRLYNQYCDSVVAQLESDVKEHLKKNMEFNFHGA